MIWGYVYTSNTCLDSSHHQNRVILGSTCGTWTVPEAGLGDFSYWWSIMVCLDQDIMSIRELSLLQRHLTHPELEYPEDPEWTTRCTSFQVWNLPCSQWVPQRTHWNNIRQHPLATSTTSALLWGEKATEAYPLLVPFLKIRYNLHQLMLGVSWGPGKCPSWSWQNDQCHVGIGSKKDVQSHSCQFNWNNMSWAFYSLTGSGSFV